MTTTTIAPNTAPRSDSTTRNDDRAVTERIRLRRATDRYSYSRCGLSPRLIRSR